MFTPSEIARAGRIVKVAYASQAPMVPSPVAQALGRSPVTPTPSPSMLKAPNFTSEINPYLFNVRTPPNVSETGFNPPVPGLAKSLAQSAVGTALKTPGVDVARSWLGLAPGRSGFMNWLGGYPLLAGGKALSMPKWVAAGKERIAENASGQGWAAPASRAMEQSTNYQQALPRWMAHETPGLLHFYQHPKQTIENWGVENLGSKYKYP